MPHRDAVVVNWSLISLGIIARTWDKAEYPILRPVSAQSHHWMQTCRFHR